MHILVYTFPVTVFIAVLIVAAAADLEINEAKKVSADVAVLNSNNSVNAKLDPINTNRKNEVHLDNNSLSNQVKSKEGRDHRKMSRSSDSSGESTDVGDEKKSKDSSAKRGDKVEVSKEVDVEKKRKDSSSKIDDKKEELKESVQQEKAKTSHTEEQKIVHGEECDSSYSCTIEEKAVVACLRVPGNESPDLSLLVQNKGKSTASILIVAPKFVRLKQNEIELQGNENKKMKVSIRNAGTDNLIILKAGDGQCTLDFKGLIDQSDKTRQLKVVSPSLMCLVALVLVLALYYAYVLGKYCRRKLLPVIREDHKYEKLDTGLPVSVGIKVETASTDGWDNSWDDNWDDEEAVPVTPSLSSKNNNLSRWSGKAGWKD